MLRGRVPVQKLQKYKLFCLLYGREIQDAMEEAWDDLLLKYSMPTGALEHQSTSLNDLNDRIDDEKSSTSSSSSLFPEAGALEHQSLEERKLKQMLAFYTARTGKEPKQRDIDAYLQGSKDYPGVADLPGPVIQWGILQSALLCRSQVNSFSYCLGAIHEAAKVGVSQETVDHVTRTFNERLEGMRAYRAGDQEKAEEQRRQVYIKSQQNLPGAGADVVSLRKKEPHT